MLKNLFLPTETNHYTPRLLSKGLITSYTLFLLVFNILTADISSFKTQAAVDSQSLLQLHNLEREKHGLGKLSLNSSLNESARRKAKAMIAHNCWDHYCPEGRSPWDFFKDAGYNYLYAGENLAEGFTDNHKVFTAWLNSLTHRENILRPEFDEIGIAIEYGNFQGVDNNAVIVVHFGKRSTYTPPTTSPATKNTVTKQVQYGKITIDSPKKDELINTNTPEIKGHASAGTVELSNSSSKLGETISKEGLFTYKIADESALIEGSHTIKAELKGQNISDTVSFTVDTIPPQIGWITLSSITQGEESYAIAEISSSSDTISIETSVEDVTIVQETETSWTAQIPINYITNNSTLHIIAYDQASNKTEQSLDLGQIKGELVAETKLLEDSSSSVSLLSQIGIRRAVNIFFIGALIALLIINYIALAKTDLPFELIRTKTNYHMSVFILLLLISIAGGTAGELLDGAQI